MTQDTLERRVCWLAWEPLGVLLEELEEVIGERRVWASLLKLLPYVTHLWIKWKITDGGHAKSTFLTLTVQLCQCILFAGNLRTDGRSWLTPAGSKVREYLPSERLIQPQLRPGSH